MKINTKKYKLGLMLTVLFALCTAVCDTALRKSPTVNDVKAEFKALCPKEEKVAAKDLQVRTNGITYKDSFIPKTNNSGFKVMTVRLTVYWAKGGDTDSYSAKMKSSTGYTLKQGESIAVDPNIIPYRKEVLIPNIGLVKAVDTGTAVKQRKASKGKLPVVDVFFLHKKDAIRFANNNPKIVKIAVIN